MLIYAALSKLIFASMNLCAPVLLASASPRRSELLKLAGFEFKVAVKNTEEIYPDTLPHTEVPLYLARLKADAFNRESLDKIVIAADTVVIMNNEILGKPINEEHAIEMLEKLSGCTHMVVTGVCITHNTQRITFSDTTLVTFKPVKRKEILYYVQNYKPMDKAGAYGVQDWIGLVAIEKIVGSFYNVMGLPIHKVYEALCGHFAA